MTPEHGTSKFIQPVITAIFSLLIVLISITLYADFDLWWHLRLGQTILHAGIPWKDTFSYTFAGSPQYTGEWLADLLIYLSYLTGSLAGVNILKALVLLIAFHYLNRAITTNANGESGAFLASMVTLLLVLFAIRFRLFVRPYIFSFVFVAYFLYVLEQVSHQHRARLLYTLPIAQALWVNMSVGAIFGPFIAICYLAEDSLRHRDNMFRNLGVFGFTLLATLASPETWGIYKLTLSLFTDPFKAVVGEYQPMSKDILWGFGLRYTWGYQLITILAVAYFTIFKGWRRPAHLLLFIFFFAETLLQVRMIEFFALVTAPMASVPLLRIFSAFADIRVNCLKWLAYSVILLISISIPLAIVNNKTYPFGIGVKKDTFPDEALSFLDRNGISGLMFNGYSIGGYIIWKAPDRKVFFDGRYRRLYTPEFYRDYAAMMENASSWKAGEQKYGFDHAVLEYEMLSRRFPLHLNTNPDWALVYWDNHSAVYLKRVPKFANIIASNEYRVCKPNFYDFSYVDDYSAKIGRAELLTSIQRDMELNPRNQEPILAKAFALYNMGPAYRKEIWRLIDMSLGLKPDIGMKHSARAYLLAENGKIDAAREEVLRAIKLDPMDQGAWGLAKTLGLKLKMPKGVHP
jgi:hypothetical protein